MNREELFLLLGGIDDRYIAEAVCYRPGAAAGSPERINPMNKKRFLSLALAAALLLSLGVVAYAAWSIHQSRQKELKEDLRIEESNAGSYTEYTVPEDNATGLVLLSAINDGTDQRVYVNISPVSEEEMMGFPGQTSFSWTVAGTELGGFAGPSLPAEVSVSGQDAIREAVMEHAYDKDTKTLTLECFLSVDMVRKAMDELGIDYIPLQIHVSQGEQEVRAYGPRAIRLTAEQSRRFDFAHARWHDAELDKEIEIVGLELTPFSAVWKVHYEGDADFHRPEADWDLYRDWGVLEDKVCIDAKIFLKDGTSFSTGGALTTPYKDGVVELHCGWSRAIDVNAVERIVLGDLVLWEKK